MRIDMSEISIPNESRRELFKTVGSGLAATLASGVAHARFKAESVSPSIALQRKDIDWALNGLNPDLLEAGAKKEYPEAIYIFVIQDSSSAHSRPHVRPAAVWVHTRH